MTFVCEDSVNKLFSTYKAYIRSEAADLEEEVAKIRSGLRAKKRTITLNNNQPSSTTRPQQRRRRSERRYPSPREHDYHQRSTMIAPKVALPTAAVLDVDYGTMWKQHELAWEKFSSNPPKRLKFVDVPWPPCDSDILEFTEQRSAVFSRTLGKYPERYSVLLWKSSEDVFLDRESKDRASYRAACKRWHPDKFTQVYGRSIVDPKESEQIMYKLTLIMQAINESWKHKATRSHIRKVIITREKHTNVNISVPLVLETSCHQ